MTAPERADDRPTAGASRDAAARLARVAVIAGDGIGAEVVPAATAVLEASGAPLELVEAEAGFGCFERKGTALPDETLALARGSDAILFGAVGSPSQRVPGYRSPIVALRRELDLFACLRPVALGDDAGRVDLLVVRESTEGLYAGRESVSLDPFDGSRRAIAERVVSERATRRLTRLAIERARAAGLTRVTVVHKANVLRESCGLFREVALEELSRAPDLDAREALVDSAALELSRDPRRFGAIVTTNLFGDILSDVAALHAGGLGLVESMNVGERLGLFEPVHGSAPDIAGSGRANPLAAVRAAARLLEHLGHVALAGRVLDAVQTVWRQGPRTPDLGGRATTVQVTESLIERLDSPREEVVHPACATG